MVLEFLEAKSARDRFHGLWLGWDPTSNSEEWRVSSLDRFRQGEVGGGQRQECRRAIVDHNQNPDTTLSRYSPKLKRSCNHCNNSKVKDFLRIPSSTNGRERGYTGYAG